MYYIEIVIKGKLDPAWSDWFDGLNILPQPCGESLLQGQVNDQSALYAVLARLNNLGLILIKCSIQENHEIPS
jgi:hypothetical protein